MHKNLVIYRYYQNLTAKHTILYIQEKFSEIMYEL